MKEKIRSAEVKKNTPEQNLPDSHIPHSCEKTNSVESMTE
jgi:hypothetical protein